MENKHISMKILQYFSERSIENQSDKIKRHNVLKYFKILYQPLFAEAWLIEKMSGSLDASLVILEKGIGKLRTILPFIKDMHDCKTISPSTYGHSNFSLIASQLHNKTGDLAFFKGNQETVKHENGKRELIHGYLLRATYHYSVALHELRRFLYHRINTSDRKLNSTREDTECLSILNKPDYLILALSSNLMDIGDSTLAKMNIFKLDIIEDSVNIKNTNASDDTCCSASEGKIINNPQDFYKIIDEWMGLSSIECNKGNDNLIFRIKGNWCVDCGVLSDWLGKWKLNDNRYRSEPFDVDGNENISYPDVLEEYNNNVDAQRLFIGIHLSWAGIRYLEDGGYYESASKEYLELATLISTSIWWITVSKETSASEDRKPKSEEPIFNAYIDYLLKFSISCLKSAEAVVFDNKLGRLAPHVLAPHVNESHKKVLYPEFITLAYSLYLLCLEKKAYKQCTRISKLLLKWGTHRKEDFSLIELNKEVKQKYFNEILKNLSMLEKDDNLEDKVNKVFSQECLESIVVKKVGNLVEDLLVKVLLDKKLHEVLEDVLQKNNASKKLTNENQTQIKDFLLLIKRLEELIGGNLKEKISVKFEMGEILTLDESFNEIIRLVNEGEHQKNLKNGEINKALNKWLNGHFKVMYDKKISELFEMKITDLICRSSNGSFYSSIQAEFDNLTNNLPKKELEEGIKKFFDQSLKTLISKESVQKTVHKKITNILQVNTFEMKKYIQKKLENHLLFMRFPILNRLRGLSVLIYSTYMVKKDFEIESSDSLRLKRSTRLKDLSSTLFYYNSLYDSPFHFTHMESGLCAYLTHKVIKDVGSLEDGYKEKFWYKKAARKHLKKSISIHTMGKAYYENITGLYYLYDDFNDRRIHMSHTLQVLGMPYAEDMLGDLNGKKG
ncbi:MAG: hypothetical protein JKY19_08185 [Alcanivoracaceae bacterium]|nr:hypothetical protein [Alcanivoracaceae bacterium]